MLSWRRRACRRRRRVRVRGPDGGSRTNVPSSTRNNPPVTTIRTATTVITQS